MLTIAVLTRNRGEEVIRALDSCIVCDGVELFEFIVLLNGTEDNSEERIILWADAHPNINLRIISSDANLGCAGGRNRLFLEAKGEYVYFLDDDAIIDPKHPNFFLKLAEIMGQNPKIATVTTAIYDTKMNGYRYCRRSRKGTSFGGYPIIDFYLGTSHIIRKTDIHKQNLYITRALYGQEELLPSLQFYQEGYYNVLCDEIGIIHMPSSSCRVPFNEARVRLIAGTICNKKPMYPIACIPFLYMGELLRCIKFFKGSFSYYKQAFSMARKESKGVKCKRMSFVLFCKYASEFGLKAAF